MASGADVEVAVAVQRLRIVPSDVAAAAPATLPRALTEGPPATAPSLRPLGEAVTLTVLVGRAGISIVY